MRPILHIHSDCAFFSGAENMVANLLNSQAISEKYDVRFSYRYSPEYDEGFRMRVSHPARTFPLPLRDLDALFRIANSLPPLLRKTWKFLILLLQVRYLFLAWNTLTMWRLFRSYCPDVLHVNNGGFPGANSCNAAVFAAHLAGIPRIVYVVNNLAMPYTSPLRWTDYPFDRLVALFVTIFVTGSEAAACQLQKVLRLQRDRVRSLHNGISPRAIHEQPMEMRKRIGASIDKVLVVMVAVIEPRKGHAVLVEAVHLLRNRLAPEQMPVVVIEGGGNRLQGVRALIQSKSLGDHIYCVGPQRHVFDLMNAADALVLPSISHEDFPNVTLEAMSLGKAVIASRLAGVPEQIDDMQSGLLVTPGNPGELAEALFTLTTDAMLRSRLGKTASARFDDRFRADIAVGRYIQLYSEVLKPLYRAKVVQRDKGGAAPADTSGGLA